MTKWGGRHSPARRDVQRAAARSADVLWARADESGKDPHDHLTPCEEVALDGVMGFDPSCRFARDNFELGLHACTTNQGQLVRPGQSCWMEANAQATEQARAERAVQ